MIKSFGLSKGDNIVSFSGGKDSTAMLLMMLERGEPIHSVIFFDTGWEFPGMLEHIDRVEEYSGTEIIRLKPRKSFLHWMLKQPVIARKGPKKGQIHRTGNGWPSPSRRWCTREKVDTLNAYMKNIKNPISLIGYAVEEAHRAESKSLLKRIKNGCRVRFPLIEWKITEANALKYCCKCGFDWDGLYDHFRRVSCFCCPLQRIGELKTLRREFPDLWKKMLGWDAEITPNLGFNKYSTVHDFEERFANEDSSCL